VAVIQHAIGDDGAEQGLHRDQHGDGEGRLDQFLHRGPVCRRNLPRRELSGEFAELGSDRRDVPLFVQAKSGDDRGGDHQPDHGTRHIARQASRPQSDHGHGCDRQSDRRPVHRIQVGGERLNLPDKIDRQLFDLQPEEIFDLRTQDENCDAFRERSGHGVGNEPDNRSQPRETHHAEHGPRPSSCKATGW